MVFDMLNHPVAEKMEVVDCYMTKSKYSYKKTYISFFVNHGPQVLNISV